jgi:polysaccharide export outer membrane protein
MDAQEGANMSSGLSRLVATVLVGGWLLAFAGPAPAAEPTGQDETGPNGTPISGDYRIGVEDVLQISVWDNKDLDRQVFVRPDGKISLPLLGEVQAGGLTVAQLTAALSEAYSRTIKGAQVSIDVQQINSRAIFFVGGVGKAGPLQLKQDLTLFQAIALAGGVEKGADLEKAFVLRGDKVISVDFVKLVQKGDISQNIKVQPGDTVVVPVADVVYVQGEVRNPGSIKYTRDLTVLKAIAQAGGFTAQANSKRVSLLRGSGNSKQKIEVDVFEMMRAPTAAGDVILEADDLILVPQRLPGVLPAG